MSTDLRAIMDRDERRRRMLNDPDLTGNRLLFALALDEVLATRKEQRRRFGGWIDDVAELAWGMQRSSSERYHVKSVISDDIPRYEPALQTHGRTCVAPMIRREGPCGKPGSRYLDDIGPETGEAHEVSFCSRHRDLEAGYDARRRAWIANGRPSPPPNAGGVLKRYFNTDWAALYHWAAPWRTPLAGAREPTPPRPMLRLVRDDESGAGAP